MKKHWVSLTVVVLAAAVLGVAGCVTTSKTSPEAFEQVVKDIWVKYSKTIMDGNAAEWIKLWDEGGVQLPPNAPMVMSVADLRKGIEAGLAAVKYTAFSIKLTGTYVDQVFGFAYGNYSFTFAPKAGGAEVKGDGKYLTIFKKQPDGSWKIFRDCFNPNTP